MKMLFISQRFVLPMDTGGKIRTGKLLEQLAQQHDITLISNVESPKDDSYLDTAHELCSRFVPVAWREVERYTARFFLRLLFQTFSRYPVSVLNTYSKDLRLAVENECTNQAYDVVLCDFVQAALVLKNVKHRRLVLFQHNVESTIARRHVEQAGNPLAKLFWWLQWKKMHRYERIQSRRFHSIIAVSKNDKHDFERLFGLDQVDTIPTGVDVEFFRSDQRFEGPPYSLVFCGSMDWLPNEDGMTFFLQEVLPLLKQRINPVKVIVVGRSPSAQFSHFCAHYPEVELTGWVDDTRPHVTSASVFIVPLRIGGGTRMKIFEAMAMRKAVVSTTIGAEGLPVSNGDHIVIADDPEEMAEQLERLLRTPDLVNQIGQNAQDYVTANYSWRKVADQFSRICAGPG